MYRHWNTLAPDEICHACSYRDQGGKKTSPQWKEASRGRQYYPSYNIAPGSYTPVLLSSQHFVSKHEGEETLTTERIIQPMQWGLVPSWHKGDPKTVMFNMNNCRSEGMLQKPSFKGPLEKGRRCVVLADGFFEWKRDKSAKQPYFISFPNDREGRSDSHLKEIKDEKVQMTVDSKDVKTETVSSDSPTGKAEQPNDVKDEHIEIRAVEDYTLSASCKNSQGMRLLTMAGVFEVWHSPDNPEPLYSYSIITVDASPAMSWIHDRMPAILTTDDEVEQWLDFGNVPLRKAIEVIRPVLCIQSHPVSSVVNNSRNKTADCVKEIDLTKKPKPSASSAFMMNWLAKGKKESPKKEEPPEKKVKLENDQS